MQLFGEKEPQTVEILGKELKCPVCSNNTYWVKNALLNTAVSTFFNLDWTDKNATCFVCSNCTHISWFLG